jgi:MFS transporter, DHA1 family, tetracycline resistance protein
MQRSRIINIFLVVFIDLLGFGLILPLLPFYAETYGASAGIVGLLVASYAAAQLVGAPFLGRLSDRHGRRPILLISILGTVMSLLLLGFAEPLGRYLGSAVLSDVSDVQLLALQNATVIGILFLSRMLDGLTGGNISVAQAYITDVTDEENRAKGLGLIGAAFGLGFILGPAAGGLLSRWGYAAPAFAAAGLAALNWVGVLIYLPESLPPEMRGRLTSANQSRSLISFGEMWSALTRSRVGPLMNIRLFFALAAALFQSIFALYAQYRLGLNAQSTGYLLAYVGVLVVLVQAGVIGRLSARFSDGQLIRWSIVLQGISLLAWAFTPSIALLMVVLIPMALSTGVLNTVINSAITKAVEPQEIGGALGVAASLESLSRVVSPTLAGFLIGSAGAWAPGLLGAAIMAGLALFTWRRLVASSEPSVSGDGENT